LYRVETHERVARSDENDTAEQRDARQRGSDVGIEEDSSASGTRGVHCSGRPQASRPNKGNECADYSESAKGESNNTQVLICQIQESQFSLAEDVHRS
jgi:hypothetical protein